MWECPHFMSASLASVNGRPVHELHAVLGDYTHGSCLWLSNEAAGVILNQYGVELANTTRKVRFTVLCRQYAHLISPHLDTI